jgi:DNA-binding MarR family transcriptional regulator
MSSPPESRARLIEALSLSVRKVIVETVLLFDTLARRMGVNATDMQCLNIHNFEGAVTAGRLAELTGLTTGAITTAIDRLEKAGYVQRVRDPLDRRRVVVQLLPQEGSEVFGAIDQAWRELCSRYSDQELALIFAFLDAMYQMNRDAVAQLRKDDAHKQAEV